MNRPTKFRVWLPSLNRFSVDNSAFINCYGKLYGVTKPSLVDDSQSIVNIGQFKELDGYTIQWYTGLTDKNNKEIFEGDIVKYKTWTGWNGGLTEEYQKQVQFKDGAYYPRYIDNECEDSWYSFKLYDIEVIGNIFELPCKFDHNSECLICDGWPSDCPFIKSK
jgi:uncharacterized phage protein (TIGR01671 family)